MDTPTAIPEKARKVIGRRRAWGLAVGLLVVGLVVGLFLGNAVGWQSGYWYGWSGGDSSGRARGYADGYTAGESAGYAKGLADGKNQQPARKFGLVTIQAVCENSAARGPCWKVSLQVPSQGLYWWGHIIDGQVGFVNGFLHWTVDNCHNFQVEVRVNDVLYGTPLDFQLCAAAQRDLVIYINT